MHGQDGRTTGPSRDLRCDHVALVEVGVDELDPLVANQALQTRHQLAHVLAESDRVQNAASGQIPTTDIDPAAHQIVE